MTFAKTRVYIGGLESGVTVENIEETFSKFGKFERAPWVAQNGTFGFVVYEEEDAAEKAVNEMNGQLAFGNSTLRVEHSRPKPSYRRDGPRGHSSYGGGSSYRGGGGGRNYGSGGGSSYYDRQSSRPNMYSSRGNDWTKSSGSRGDYNNDGGHRSHSYSRNTDGERYSRGGGDRGYRHSSGDSYRKNGDDARIPRDRD